MIRALQKQDLDRVAEIWLDTNIKAHDFIEPQYWQNNLEAVKAMLPQAEVFVYVESDVVQGFVGLHDNYIEGIFVWHAAQCGGIGKQLLEFVKARHTELQLRVYQKNGRAIKFYQREGFQVQSESVDENTGQQEYLMAWTR